MKCFIYISSTHVIGKPKVLPITESHLVNPLDIYYSTKLFAEHLTGLLENDGFNAYILRIPSPIGQKMPKNKILTTFVRNALQNRAIKMFGMGTRKQNYVDVRDIAYAVSLCLEKSASGIFNIAGKSCISNLDLANTCIKLLRSSSKIVFSDQPDPDENLRWEISISKAEKILGYMPKYTIEDSISHMAAQYENSID